MKPSVGRIVHYAYDVGDGVECFAAIVVSARATRLDLALFPKPRMIYPERYTVGFWGDVPYSETPRGGYWHWPEREE